MGEAALSLPTAFIVKRNGEKELYSRTKMVALLERCLDEKVAFFDINDVMTKLERFVRDGLQSDRLHREAIKIIADEIDASKPDYALVAGRLLMRYLRKIAYGESAIPHLYAHTKKLVKSRRYDASLLEDYSEAEFDELNSHIDHDRDFNLAYAGAKTYQDKYLLSNRVTRRVLETPQIACMLIAAWMFAKYPKSTRMTYVKDMYDALSNAEISLPTPIMSGVRTRTLQFSSCVLIETGDSIQSISTVASAIYRYISQRAGLGINVGKLRGVGSSVREGEATSTGLIPFIRSFQGAVKSCSQGGTRGGSATVFYPIWHLEVEDLLVLRNNRGTEESRARHLDFAIQINGYLWERIRTFQEMYLFSPNDVPDLYEAFFADQAKFAELYEKYGADPAIRKSVVSAIEIGQLLASERSSTGRDYIMNVDHCNLHSSFLPHAAPVRQSNLCMEITLPTEELMSLEPQGEGEVALCTLAAVNLGPDTVWQRMRRLMQLLVRGLDEILSRQNYPMDAARRSVEKYRPLGIGVINYAYFLAKNGAKYSDSSGNGLTHRIAESMQFYALQASCELAQEKGPCTAFHNTTYSKGILPIDTYTKFVDTLTDEPLHLDWEWLRGQIVTHGLRNATLSALMPSETSSQVANATNGIEPIKDFVVIKGSESNRMALVAPEMERLYTQYELTWDMPSHHGYLDKAAIWQKFVDQAISTNTYYDPRKFNDGKIPMKLVLQDLLRAYQRGLKTLYYSIVRDGQGDDEDGGCASGACKI